MCRMYKVYNTFDDYSNGFRNFLKLNCPFVSKTLLNIMPEVLTSMINSTSCITKNISLNCKGKKFDFIHYDSIQRRVRRFFNNENYQPYVIYDSIIKCVISKFACKHRDSTIHIVFDHMFKSEFFVTFMISLRIGKKSIPIWYRCFKGGHDCKEALQEEMITEGIKYVSNLFADKPNLKLVFLADRWFGSTSLLQYIEDLGHFYVVRAKGTYNVWYHDNKEGHEIKTKVDNLFHYVHKATYYEDVLLSDNKFKTNIVFSATKSISISKKATYGEVEPWILLTNCDVRRAVKWYGYRFSAIEFLFKDQKSNGFNLEKSSVKNLQAFIMMYTCINICILFLVCISTYYTRHKNSIYKGVKIRYYSTVKEKHFRKMSIFRVGYTLFNLARDSLRYIKIPFNFVLTDV